MAAYCCSSGGGGRSFGLADTFVTSNGMETAENLELDYLEEYPPGSVGDMLIAMAEGGSNEE